ncbi:MAG: DUF2268 domain-containing protein, partial [Candidatus Diapherotrites archaeon]|nr:DUF2268 domain-containing protein [Candidatus Diapherotrites archaeon]
SIFKDNLSKVKSKRLFKTLGRRIHSRFSWNEGGFYNRLFFGGGEFPRWAGYSMGYWMVKSFRKSNMGLSWKEIIALPPKLVWKKSDFA